MNYRPRFKTVAYCVAVALAQLAAGAAHADTAIGVDTALGNTLNPPGRSAVPRDLTIDADVMDTIRHSPTGQLYGVPLDERESTQTESGWNYSGGVDNLYRPLVSWSFVLQLRLTGDRPWPMHAVNWLLHAANAALVA